MERELALTELAVGGEALDALERPVVLNHKQSLRHIRISL